MNEILDFYQQQAQDKRSILPWLAKIQTNALNHLKLRGFPTRHDEEWKYTAVDALLKPFAKPDKACTRSSPMNSDLPVNHSLSFYNGFLENLEAFASQLPAHVVVLPLSEALERHAGKVKACLGTILVQEHGFHLLNTAMMDCGLFIYIPAGVCIKEPIVLSHFQDKMNQAVYLRHLIIAEEGSQATILEEYRGEEQCSYLTNVVSEVFVAPGAHITHYKVQRESKSALHIGHLSVKQSANSHFASHSLSLGGKLVRSDISLYLEQAHASCLMNGIYAPGEGQHVDHHTTVEHRAPECRSVQDYKGILRGHSRAVFNGKVKVAKDAQHTDARQQNKNLLLSAHAEIDTKPQLEIFADDVMCSHGATVGQLDEDALFYLATRGIDRLEASQYLIQAFAMDNLRNIPDSRIADWMSNLLSQQME